MWLLQKNGKYELTDELPNDLKTKNLSTQSSLQNENIVNTSKKSLEQYLEQYFTWNLKLSSNSPVNGSSYEISRCAMPYPWPGVRKCWLIMLSNFKQCFVIDNLLTDNFR